MFVKLSSFPKKNTITDTDQIVGLSPKNARWEWPTAWAYIRDKIVDGPNPIEPSEIGALQPGDNISELVNDAGYITTGNIDAKADKTTTVTGGGGLTGGGDLSANRVITLDSATVDILDLAQSALQPDGNGSQLTGMTKSQVGLGNVDNTSDATKNAASGVLTNKTISGASNTITNIAQSSITNLSTDLANKITGPSSANNNYVPVFDGTSGKLLADSGLSLLQFVRTIDAQSIDGVKTFTSAPIVPNNSFTQAKVTNLTTDLANRIVGPASANNNYVPVFDGTSGKLLADSGLSLLQFVRTIDAQSIDGVKTFTSAPVVPNNSFAQSKIINLTTDLAAKAPATIGTDILYGNGTGGFSSVVIGSGLVFTGGTLAASAPEINFATNTQAAEGILTDVVLSPSNQLIGGAFPNGTTAGYIQALREPSDSVAGNARGAGAVDFQQIRDNAAQVASGTKSVICGGRRNTNSGNESFIGGGQVNTVVPQLASIVGGYNNTISNYGGGSFIGGGSSNLIPSSQNAIIVGGTNNQSRNSNISFIGGGNGNNCGNGVYSAEGAVIVGGTGNLVLYRGFIGGGDNNVVFSTHGVVCGGDNNQVLGGRSFIGGGTTNTVSSYSSYNTIGGGRQNTAGAQYSFVGGGQNNTISRPHSSIGGGQGNQIVGGYSSHCAIGGGLNNSTTSGYQSTIAGGVSNAISANYAIVAGGGFNSLLSDYSAILGGLYGQTTRYAEQAHAAGRFGSDSGSAQRVDMIARISTSDATPTNISLAGADSVQRITIAQKHQFSFIAHITGINSSGSKSASYIRRGVIKNIGGTTSISAVQTIGTDIEDDAATDVSITADDTNDALQIQVTGVAAEDWRWVAHIEGVQTRFVA